MTRPNTDPIPTPWPQRAAELRQRFVPLGVWAMAALICIAMLGQRAVRFEYIGLAEAMRYEISASTTGMLNNVIVDLYDTVRAGDIVAVMDDAEFAAQIDTANAMIRQLRAGLVAARSDLMTGNDLDRADWVSELRRFQNNEEDRRLEALSLRVRIETDQVELERLRLEMTRNEPLVADGIVGRQQYDDIRLEHDRIRQRIEDNQVLLAQTETEYGAARNRRVDFENDLPAVPEEEPALAPLREAITVETHRLAEIQARRRSTVLRTPVSGQVSQILCRRGQTVVPGEPILTVTEQSVQQIVAFLAEGDERVVQPNDPVLVSSLSRPEAVAETVVLRVGSGLDPLPQRLWRDPTTPNYGRAVVIAAAPALNLKPGELLNVRFDSR